LSFKLELSPKLELSFKLELSLSTTPFFGHYMFAIKKGWEELNYAIYILYNQFTHFILFFLN